MKQEFFHGEQRREFRATSVLIVDYSTVDSFFRDFSENISAGGMFIATKQPLQLGTKLSLEFLLPKSDSPIKVEAEVAWRRTTAESGQKRGMGVKFNDLSADAKDKINAIVKELRYVP